MFLLFFFSLFPYLKISISICIINRAKATTCNNIRWLFWHRKTFRVCTPFGPLSSHMRKLLNIAVGQYATSRRYTPDVVPGVWFNGQHTHTRFFLGLFAFVFPSLSPVKWITHNHHRRRAGKNQRKQQTPCVCDDRLIRLKVCIKYSVCVSVL